MKRFLLLLFACFSLLSIKAQRTTYNTSLQPPRPKVGIVLGGGGAKGATHIGVLKYIEELGVPIDYVAGTSMGSIMGGLYAMGYEPNEIAQLISQVNWSAYIGNKIDRNIMAEDLRKRSSTTLLNIPFGRDSQRSKVEAGLMGQLPSAFVINSSLINLFNNLCVGYQEEMDFNNMPIPFACVATDLITGEEVVIRNGSVPTAIRASMAIPGVFAPVVIEDKVLVDGGLVNNFPADVLREMGADIIIGVEITKEQHFTPNDLKSLPQVMTRLLTNTTNAKRDENRKLCDIYIAPDVSGYGMLSFNAAAIDTLVNRGYKVAQLHHDKLVSIKQYVEKSASRTVCKELHAPRAKNLSNEAITIQSIEIKGVSDKQNRWLNRKSGLIAGNSYTSEDIERAVNIYRGTSCFDDITYTIKESDSIHLRDSGQLSNTYDLTINMKPAQPHVIGVGLRYDTEEGAAILLNIGINEKKFSGSKISLSGKLSYSPRFDINYTLSQPSLANFSLAYGYRNEHFRCFVESNRGLNMRYQQHKLSGYISQFHLLNFSTNVGLSYTHTTYDLSSFEGSPMDSLVFTRNLLLTPFVNLVFDNLDDTYFAKHGVKARLTGRYHFDMDTPDEQYGSETQFLELAYSFQSYITPNQGRFSIIPQFYGRYVSGNPLYYNLWSTYGGEIASRHFEEQLPFIGYTTLSVASDNTCVLRLDLRYNIYEKHYLTAMYNFMANFDYLTHDDLTLSDVFDFNTQGAGLKYSYESPLGPISLTGHWSKVNSTNHFGAYFSLGFTF